MDREELISKATRIAEIRRELERLSELQQELRTLEASLDAIASGSAHLRTRRRTGVSIEDRVFGFLQEHPDRDWDAEQIARELDIKVPTTRAAFSKLRGSGKVKDTARGRVQLKREAETLKEEDAIDTIAA
jgi:AraC-like DNA-binding protein